MYFQTLEVTQNPNTFIYFFLPALLSLLFVFQSVNSCTASCIAVVIATSAGWTGNSGGGG